MLTRTRFTKTNTVSPADYNFSYLHTYIHTVVLFDTEMQIYKIKYVSPYLNMYLRSFANFSTKQKDILSATDKH